MKKLLVLLVTCLLCLGCSHDMPDVSQTVTDNYNTAFVKTFGQPAVNQNWGFGSLKATTRSAYPNSNDWAKEGYSVPGAVTQSEINDVLQEFSKVYTGQSESLVDWDCFFVQHVYGGHGNMDYLCSYDPVGHSETIYVEEYNWQPHEITSYDDHINNFNATSGSIQLMINSSTNQFGYHNSLDSKMHYKYRMVAINGGYYVGFDFEATGKWPNQQVAADNIYNDWIVKITYGKNQPPQDKLRIIAEDLSAKDGTDFDFNDVVFDVNITSDGASCVLQAAGGTLPLKIEGLEVHELFGVSTSDMVNTGGISKPAVPFTLQGISNAKDIRITVLKNGEWVELKAQQGVPAAKIAVRQDFEWCAEREPITSKYPNFPNWVKDVDYVWY